MFSDDVIKHSEKAKTKVLFKKLRLDFQSRGPFEIVALEIKKMEIESTKSGTAKAKHSFHSSAVPSKGNAKQDRSDFARVAVSSDVYSVNIDHGYV